MNIATKIKYICKNDYSYFLKKSNVVGVAEGYKIIKGFGTWQKCITVFVQKKINKRYLIKDEVVPELYKGITTDVIESGIFKELSLTGRIRPVKGGYIIGNVIYSKGGTFGGLVTDGEDYFMLTNNHVIALDNEAEIGTNVIQPSIGCGGNIYTDVVGSLYKYIPIKFIKWFLKPVNHVDCALAKVIDKNMVTSEIEFIGKLKGASEPKLNEQVKKVGYKSELTNGTITNLNATIIVENSYVQKKSLFENQIVTTAMCEPGDSGSILASNENYAVGLSMAGSTTKSTFNSMNTVLKNLNVKLVID